MNKELENKLKEKYPGIFQDLYGDPKHTCMAFGIECGDGWYSLIDRICARAIEIGVPDDFRAMQIKEKFGGLRFYVSNSLGEVNDMIWEMCDESYSICESCGTRKEVTTEGGWIKTLCSNCRLAENKNNS